MGASHILFKKEFAAREMLLALRQLKRSYFDQREFRKYLLYAAGETVLIIVGIIIALRIDNWNNERIDEQRLQSALATISRNVESDLLAVATIEAARLRAYELSLRWLFFHNHARRMSADVEEIRFASSVISGARERLHFIANTVGFDALKSSGAMGRLRGKEIEGLLYDYYDTVNRIDRIERDHNDQVGRLELAMTQSWPSELERWMLSSPYVLSTERLESLQEAINRLLLGTSTNALIDMPMSATDLLLEYEKLQVLGGQIVELISKGQFDMDAAAMDRLGAIHDPASKSGNPNLIVDGQIPWYAFHAISSDSNDASLYGAAGNDPRQIPFTHDSFARHDKELSISVDGSTEWAGIWLETGPDILLNAARDYSEFDSLVIEMKGDTGGEIVTLNIEDSEDPKDGTSTRIEVELSDRWETYEIDLDEFETVDFSIVSIPLGFIFFEEPVSFAIRSARYARKSE